MRHRRMLAAVLLMVAGAAHAEHFQYVVSLQGTSAEGGTDGCFPPFDQPACPRPGYLSALLSFDTPVQGDGSFSVTANFGDVTDFHVNLGQLTSDDLYGGINVVDGSPDGSVQASDLTESFSFDWADRTASFDYDYGYHGASGAFSGTLSNAPEPATPALMLAGLAGLAWIARRPAARRRK